MCNNGWFSSSVSCEIQKNGREKGRRKFRIFNYDHLKITYNNEIKINLQ